MGYGDSHAFTRVGVGLTGRVGKSYRLTESEDIAQHTLSICGWWTGLYIKLAVNALLNFCV